ncbi:translation initiation factor IF-2, partial [Candidatus Margulisiibacteriota bacterium]
RLGIMATINQRIDHDIAKKVAGIFEHKVIVDIEESPTIQSVTKAKKEEHAKMVHRPPVVVVMGHVDHGKTLLLDTIKKTDVIATEAGGITQHIGAYQVNVHGKKVTFLDTPGHEAFTALRSRGAKVTDIAVLVVAADDGVKPQTVEAIDHAKAAGVPIIVAINKIDKDGANIDRVKQQLAEHELVSEDWGGKTVMVPISAKQGKNINDLLEMILIVAEIQDLKANPHHHATGIIIEAKLDKGRGAVATVLIGNGTLKVGDAFYAGSVFGKVRALINDKGERIKTAPPSTPVEVLGASEMPEPGEVFRALDEKLAKKLAEARKNALQNEKMMKGKLMSLEDFSQSVKEGKRKDLNIILKTDVGGSLEALKKMLFPLTTADVRVSIIHSGVGAISESDIMLAKASQAIVIGFHVAYEGDAKALADTERVDSRIYDIIYMIGDDLKLAMEGMLEPEYEEAMVGKALVKNTFKFSKVGVIAGCMVTEGKMVRNSNMRVSRDGEEIYSGKMESLKRFKDDAKEVEKGYECGIAVKGFTNFKEGDEIESIELRLKPRKKL